MGALPLHQHPQLFDGLGLRVDALALLAKVSRHFLSYGQVFRAQTAQLLGFEAAHIEHVHSVPNPPRPGHSNLRRLPCTDRAVSDESHRHHADGSHARDDLHLRQALPRQAQHQGVELLLRQGHRR